MRLKCGIIGLPNAGKSTIFNALCETSKAEASIYPFCTIEPNRGVVPVPDERIRILSSLTKPEKTVYPVVEFVDIAGLVKGASKGEGLGNKFLSHIREVDAIIHVVRCFENSNVSHVEGSIDPIRDVEIINLELLFSDLEIIERRLEKLKKLPKSKEYEVLVRIKEYLDRGEFPKSINDKEILKSYNLLTLKPTLYVANVDDKSINGNEYTEKLENYLKEKGLELLKICGKIEAELNEFDEKERKEFLKDLGIKERGLNILIKEAYKLLNLITFFTILSKEVKGWPIKKGTKAIEAAGKIHKDFQKGFIKADVVHFNDFIKAGSETKCRELGLIRSEGKDYEVQDGDIIHFRFNV